MQGNKRRGSIALLAVGVVVLPPAAADAQTFQNTTPITIADAAPGMTPMAASPFPSGITVPAGNGIVTSVQVAVNGFSHTNPDDVDVVLRGPGAEHNVMLFSDAGGTGDVVGQTLRFDEACLTFPPDEGQLSSGSFKTSNYGAADDGFGSMGTAPGPPYESLSSYAGTDINTFATAWNLYVIDDTDNTQAGSISGGWSITFNAPSSCAAGDGDSGGDTQPKADRTLTLDANKGKVEKGRKVRLSGQIDAPQNEAGCEPNQAVELQRKKKKAPDTAFTTFDSVQTDATGNFADKVKVKKTRIYRAQVQESEACDDELSNTQKVRVQKPSAAKEA
jgi:hypothetical protein